MAITHAIFDVGGTVIDCYTIIANILRKYAESVGKELLPEIEGKLCSALTFSSFIQEFFDSIELKDEKIRETLQQELAREVLNGEYPLTSGVDKLIKHLYKHNIPMAIATNGSNHEFKAITKCLDNYFERYFTHYICGADDPEVKNNKPFPDVYLICAKRFKTEPKSLENCVIFEDSMTGITGAVDSGMKTVLINDRRFYNFESIANKITSIVNSFDDFSPESVGLPKYEY